MSVPLVSASAPTPKSQQSSGTAPAVILLSGGLDSATVLALVHEQGREAHCLSFSYGQRHSVELAAAKAVAQAQGAASFQVVNIDLRAFGGSALTADIAVPKEQSDEMLDDEGEIPITYVPARNTIFLSFALAKAEVTGAREIYIGANAVDYSGYPDCRPAFIEAFEQLANLATARGAVYAIKAPLMTLTKAEIITMGTKLGVDYSITHSCYDPSDDGACGQCDSCLLRQRGFRDAGVPDPTRYGPSGLHP